MVEIEFEPNEVLMRDSKDPAGPVIRFSRESWTQFLGAVRRGDLDRPDNSDPDPRQSAAS